MTVFLVNLSCPYQQMHPNLTDTYLISFPKINMSLITQLSGIRARGGRQIWDL